MSEPIDHDALWRSTLATLNSLGALRISPSRVKKVSGSNTVVGGFGDVEKGRLRTSWFATGPYIAIKRLRPSGDRNARIRVIAALARELLVWSRLRHKNILALEGFYFDESSLQAAWIVTLWQQHGNIMKYIEATQPGGSRRLELVMDTARGIAYLHSLSPSVCHADIKAENTLVDNEWNALICDFGLAKIMQDIPSGLTTAKTANWTTRYAAPELVSVEEASHTLQSDVWAWGCLVLVIMTGLRPYNLRATDYAVLVAISQSELPANLSSTTLPDLVKAVLERCWQPAPTRPSVSWCLDVLSDRQVDVDTSNARQGASKTRPLDIETKVEPYEGVAVQDVGASTSSAEDSTVDLEPAQESPAQANVFKRSFERTIRKAQAQLADFLYPVGGVSAEEEVVSQGQVAEQGVKAVITGVENVATGPQGVDAVHALSGDLQETGTSEGEGEPCVGTTMTRGEDSTIQTLPTQALTSPFDSSPKSTPEFEDLLKLSLRDVPKDYKSTGPDWDVVYNPAFGKNKFKTEFLSHFEDKDFRPMNFTFTGDGQGIAACNEDTAALYDLNTHKLQLWGIMENVSSSIHVTCFSHDTSLLATGHGKGPIRIWDVQSKTLRQHISGHKDDIISLAFAESNAILAAISVSEKVLRTWSVETGAILQEFRGLDYCAVRLAASPCHPFVVAFEFFGGNTVYDARHGGLIAKVSEQGDRDGAFTSDGHSVVSWRDKGDAELKHWDLRSPLERRQRKPSTASEVSLDAEVDSFKLVRSIKGPQGELWGAAISSDGKLVASTSFWKNDLVLWDLASGLPVMKLRGERLHSVRRVTFQPGSTASKGMLAFTQAPPWCDNKRNLIQFVRYSRKP